MLKPVMCSTITLMDAVVSGHTRLMEPDAMMFTLPYIVMYIQTVPKVASGRLQMPSTVCSVVYCKW